MNSDVSTTRLVKAVAATGLMLLLGLLVAPKISKWHSHQLAARLVVRIANAEDAQVKVPLRQLADLGETAIEPLVAAAASERAAVATIARQIIDEKLAAWELLAGSSDTATSRLATALALQIEAFGPAGKQWAEQLALAMIEISEKLPAQQTRELLEHCDRIFAAVPPRGPRLRTLTAHTEIAALRVTNKLSAPEPKLKSMTQASEPSLEVFARIPPGVQRGTQNQLTRVEPRSREAGGSTSRPLDWSTRGGGEFRRPLSPAPSPQTLQKLPKSKLTLAPKLVDVVDHDVVDIPTPRDMTTSAAAYRSLSDEELLLRLRKANFYEAGVLRSVLVERGFADAELALRQQFASPEVNDRLRFVEEVSQLPAATARRLLRWLLKDESGDVRLRALTALATTNSPSLNDLARELAMNDEDPRVAKLASRLLLEIR